MWWHIPPRFIDAIRAKWKGISQTANSIFFYHHFIGDGERKQTWVRSLTVLNSPPLVPHICVSEWGQHWLRQWLVVFSAPKHNLKRCWLLSIGPVGTNFSEFYQNTKPFNHENEYENIVCEMAAILSRGWWVNSVPVISRSTIHKTFIKRHSIPCQFGPGSGGSNYDPSPTDSVPALCDA